MKKGNSFEKIAPAYGDDKRLSLESLKDAYSFREHVPVGTLGYYVVHFFSIRRPDASTEDIETLLRLDGQAARDAERQDGHVVYSHDDDVGEDGVGSSFCIWETPEAASAASQRPAHRQAVQFVIQSFMEERPVYSIYTLSTYQLDRPNQEELNLTRVGKPRSFEPQMFEPVAQMPEPLAA